MNFRSIKRMMASAVLAASVGSAAPVLAQTGAALNLPTEGWVSWDVDAVDSAQRWCCFDWDGGAAQSAVCNLDGRKGGYGSRGEAATVSSIRIYARMHQGKPDRIRALATDCPVKTNTPILSRPDISSAQSLSWLRAQLSPRSSLSGDAMAGLAVHRGAEAASMLDELARRGPDVETRKEAIFWATQVRGAEGLGLVLPLYRGDPDPNIREHAAFAVAQTKAPAAIAALISVARSDSNRQVRSQSWFWLAQTGSTQSESEINRALTEERDGQVREQAVFALSQLPEPRNVQALISVAERSELGRDVRKQAVFWLGQSEANEATQYLDRLLAGSPSR